MLEAARTYFCHVRGLKQREKASSGYVVFRIAVTNMMKGSYGF